MDLEDDRRTAASIVTGLSSYVATATLAVLGAQAVIVTFVLDKREHLDAFYGLSVVAFIALTLSIFIGGKGVYEIAEQGAEGRWKTTTRRKKFAWQSGLALLGVILVGISTITGDKKEAAQDMSSAELMHRVQRLDADVRTLKQANLALRARIVRLERRRVR